uniref:Uncharacterized protein n=1 Tax=Chromera velia CCMP2878 TaxID=1169474 RepID=A0A0G4GQ71_9ALVE|eukprot:Cvel_723.t1-p1 / transcript=Cvel_723.t1 / gene=Cvel_723 / organism=Chromera_velia_CCMP2878 / gene_product=hypothetical protein / transcript_product=hypothetical protein / location=Cvel_scaffold22:136598-136972(+) / protein_length=125 / sequence_SO=supercontig / SO=protein_coding / is_pseudo=false
MGDMVDDMNDAQQSDSQTLSGGVHVRRLGDGVVSQTTEAAANAANDAVEGVKKTAEFIKGGAGLFNRRLGVPDPTDVLCGLACTDAGKEASQTVQHGMFGASPLKASINLPFGRRLEGQAVSVEQ